MTNPQAVEIDSESEAGYVCYSKADVAETVEVWEKRTVAADLDSSGNVVGIEVLSFDEETLSRARVYAQEHDLVFPEPLEAATYL